MRIPVQQCSQYSETLLYPSGLKGLGFLTDNLTVNDGVGGGIRLYFPWVFGPILGQSRHFHSQSKIRLESCFAPKT